MFSFSGVNYILWTFWILNAVELNYFMCEREHFGHLIYTYMGIRSKRAISIMQNNSTNRQPQK